MSTNFATHTLVNGKDETSRLLNPSSHGGNPNGHRRRGRILCLSLFAVLILVSVGFHVFKRLPVLMRDDDIENIADDPRIKPYQNPANAQACAEWPLMEESTGSTELHSSSVSFTLPAAFNLLFFVSRGPVTGHLNIIQSQGYSSPGSIEVNVTAHYHDRDDLQYTKACRAGQEVKNEHGVLIWAQPNHPHHDHRRDVSFNITVAIPRNIRGYKDLTTDFTMFSHHIGDFFDIWSPTTFEIVRLRTSNAAIRYVGLVADSAFIQTSDAQVEGFFVGPHKYHVHTSNSPIRSVSMMIGEAPGAKTEVKLRTSNAPISANLAIITDFADTKLKASVHTSHGELVILMPRAMMVDNSSFYLDASTSAANATIMLHPDYEGTYDLGTSVADAHVVENTEVRDPSGKGRQRTLQRTSSGHRAQGYMYWSHNGEPSEEGKNRGSITVRTSKLPVTLHC